MRIAVDAMGGDYTPATSLEAVVEALEMYPDVDILYVGHKEKLAYYMEKMRVKESDRLKIVHAETVVEMGEPSTTAIKSKKDSSITVCATLVAQKMADGVVSPGHTGAAVAASKVRMRMVPGVDRPCIGSIMPNVTGKWILADAGGNTDCTPLNLAQFAVMGEQYAKYGLGIKNPTIGLLSVGGEDAKGNELTKATFKILSRMPINFIGNVEGHDTFMGGCDVVVCDGFVGNVLLKSAESLAMATFQWINKAFRKNALRMTGALLAKDAFREINAVSNFEEYGGAPLLGLNGICIIGHGSSTPKAIRNAIRVANEFAIAKVPEQISNRIYECGVEKEVYAEKWAPMLEKTGGL